MAFHVESLTLSGLARIVPTVREDERGAFSETWKASAFAALGLGEAFVQDNHSVSRRGVLRGLHYQLPPHAQGKLVRVVRGRIHDVCVDLRRPSPTFGRHDALELSANDPSMLWVPPGFAHGFLALEDDTHVLYKTTAEYAPDAERGIRWDDPDLAIEWPGRDMLVSPKDRAFPTLAQADAFENLEP